MSSSDTLLLKFYHRTYHMLLFTFPAGFRHRYAEEMLGVFDDLLRYEVQHKSRPEIAFFWLRSLLDLLLTALVERNQSMKANQQRIPILAAFILLPSALFIFINVTKYNLGIDVFYDLVAGLIPGYETMTASNLFTLLILACPPLALLLAAFPIMRADFTRAEDGTIVSTMSIRPQLSNLLIISLCLLAGMIFMLYFFVENFEAMYR